MTTTQAPADQSPPITLRGLLEAGAHFGHPTKRWHPKMKPYIFTARNKIHVFDLAKTIKKLETAADFVEKLVGDGGQVMLVGTKKQAQEAISDIGQQTHALYVNQRWLGGMLTNFQTIQKRIEYVVPHHPGVRALAEEPRLMEVLTQLACEPVVLFKEKINYKLPGGSGFVAHQDAAAGWGEYSGFSSILCL